MPRLEGGLVGLLPHPTPCGRPVTHVCACVCMCVSPQVVDLISLKPFDMETIAKSVKKTRKVIIVEECMKTGAWRG